MIRSTGMASLFFLILATGCDKPLFTAQVGSASQPVVQIDDGAISVAASAPAIEIPPKLVNFEPGAISLKIDAPVQQDFNIPKLGWIGLIAIIVLAWWAHPPAWLRRDT